MTSDRKLLLALFLLSFRWIAAQDHYTLSIDDLANRTVSVKAIIHLKGDLLMSPFGAEHLEMGWSTFVEGLTARDAEGNLIPIETMPGGVIKMEEEQTLIELSYTIKLQHEQHPWPFGYKEAAYVINGMLMATGNALFITQLEMDSAVVEFDLPARYDVATAWKQIEPRKFAIKGAEELVWTVIAIGEFYQQEFRSGEMDILLVHGEDLLPYATPIEEITGNAITAYEDAYGGPPKNSAATGKRYLQVINIDSNYVGGGAAFTNSISLLLNSAPDTCVVAASTCWHHILVHELGHLWNGHTLRAAETDQWFIEGFTEYLAFRIQRDMELYPQKLYDDLLVRTEQEYDAALKDAEVPLAEAGTDKGRYYDLIYAGGLHFADRLDRKIKAFTSDEHDLLDVLQRLYTQYAGSDLLITKELLQRTSEEVCGCELEQTFQMLLRR